MRSPREIFLKAKVWSAIVGRCFIEPEYGRWELDPDMYEVLEETILNTEEERYLRNPNLNRNDFNEGTWYCEPAKTLLWVLSMTDFPPQDSDISIYGVINSAGELDPEKLSLRAESEIQSALEAQFWVHRRVYGFIKGKIDQSLSEQMKFEGANLENPFLKLSDGDLEFDGHALSVASVSDLPYQREFLKVTGSRLSALRWVLGMEVEDSVVNHSSSPYSLNDTEPADVERLYLELNTETSRSLVPALSRATWLGDLEAIQRACAENTADIQVDIEGFTALGLATKFGLTKSTEALLEHGKTELLDQIDGRGRYPLQLAIQQGNQELVKLLVDAGAGVDGPPGTDPPIFEAIKAQRADIVEYLCDKDCDFNDRDRSLKTPLMEAADRGDGECVRVLLNRKAKVDYQDGNENSALHMACRMGNLEALKLLLEHKPNLEFLNVMGLNPMALAAYRGEEECALAMIDAGSKIMLIAPNGQTPLHYACRLAKSQLAQRLLEGGADIDHKSDNDYTPLHAAALSGEAKPLLLLLNNGVKVDIADGSGMTPLHTAANRGYPEMVIGLLKAKAPLEWRSQGETTVLHVCCYGHHVMNTLELLLNAGADVEAIDCEGNSPLHFIGECGLVQAATLLLEHKADPSMKNKNGQTALDVARDFGHSELAKFLESRSWRVE